MLFNFPPNAGTVGSAAYLSVFASLFNTLRGMADAGYTVDVPHTVDALRDRLLRGNASLFGANANVAARVPVNDHVRRQRWLDQIEAQWGPAPGRQQTDGASLFILGERFGNVFVGIQPAFGYEGDPMRLLFERGFAPTHAFCAFYRWINQDFGADAVLHFGTHGALEFMPGKQAGMSAECWPDRLIGDLPNFYLYASNNPSEGMIAKRRAGAALISYLTPPVAHAGLYRGLLDLKAISGSLARTAARCRCSPARCADRHWCRRRPWRWIWRRLSRRGQTSSDAASIAGLLELEYTLIPHGLHVVGEGLDAEQRGSMLDAANVTDAAERQRLDALLAVDHEVPAILHALDAGYIRPAPGGDLLRTTEVLPTGRNLHGFDPFRIPSAFAVRDGALQADRLLARYKADNGALPETVAMVLWGTDNLKTEGGPIAQALWLLGAEPRTDSYGRVSGAKLVPLERLGRPRIDVVATLSGIFRDLLPLQTKLLAEAALLAATAEEPAEHELRPHARAGLPGRTRWHDAGCGSAGLRQRRWRLWLQRQQPRWQRNVERRRRTRRCLSKRKGFAYGVDVPPARHDAVLAHALARVDLAYQNLDSIEVGRHHGRPLLRYARRHQPCGSPGAGRCRDRRSISATRPAVTVPSAQSPNRSPSKPAPVH